MQQPGQPTAGGAPKFNWKKIVIWLIVIGLLLLLILWTMGVFSSKPKDITLNEIIEKKWTFKSGQWQTGPNSILFRKKDTEYNLAIDPSMKNAFFRMIFNPNFKESTIDKTNPFYDFIRTFQGLPKEYKPPAGQSTGAFIINILLSLLPVIIMVSLFVWLGRRGGAGGGMGEIFSGGKNQARKITSKFRFSDVAGQKEVKEEVSEVVDFLKKPSKYKAAGARIPKGIMLSGPPGTGKTLMAKAVAGEASVPFYFISASNFVEMFAGLGAKRVREMFKESRKAAPSILFIDELDAIGRKRGSSLSGNDEREQTLNQILVEMDGMDENSGLLIIAATNRADVLDPALLRPGRFDRKITVGLPDIKEREAILNLHAKGKRISKHVDFKNIAKRTARFSGAQLENVINEAALLSVRENSEIIKLLHIDEAIDRVVAGPAKKHRIISPEENRMVAIHEAGHAVAGLKIEGANIVQKITIIPRGDAGGYTLSTPKKEQYNYSRTQLEAMIVGALGGRAAEQVEYGIGEVSTGASNDIEKATAIARAMVTQYGMSDLGPIAYEKAQGSYYLGQERVKEYSDALAERIDESIRKIIIAAEVKAIAIIKKHRNILDLIVLELLEKETILFEEINYINKYEKRPPKIKEEIKSVKAKKSLDEIIKKVKSKKTETQTTKVKTKVTKESK